MKRSIMFALAIGLLLEFGTTPFAASSEDMLAAIRNGDHAQVEVLLRGGADANSADADGTTALMHAVIEADPEMMQLLLSKGANVNAQNAQNSSALMYALTSLAKTRLLLDAGADVKVKNKRGDSAMSVAATTYGSTPVLKLLADRGAQTETSMMNAVAQKGDLEAMQFLFSIGLNPGATDNGPMSAALGARCEECVRLLLSKGASVNGAGASGRGVLAQTVKRAMTEMSQLMLDRGASLQVKDREGFTLLMQAVLSWEPVAQRDRMVQWLLEQGVDPNETNMRGETAYQLAARMGGASTLQILVKAGAREITEERPKPAGGRTARQAVEKVLPLIETSGEAIFKNRKCVACHQNSLPAMTVALARQKGLTVNAEQAKKELGFAVATDGPLMEPMRLGANPVGGGSDTVGYTLLGMAAAGYPPDASTDAHVHYLSIYQYPDGSWKTTAYRPPTEYSPFSTTAVALTSMRLYPIPGRKKEFEERFARAKRWLLSTNAYSGEEKIMQLNGLVAAGASLAERERFVKALKGAQNADGSWNLMPGMAGDAYATGATLYALHVAGNVSINDAVYKKGVQWLLRNQLSDGSWFVPTRTSPIQPFFESGFPHGSHQWISDGASSWSSMALLFTLPDSTDFKQSSALPWSLPSKAD